MSDARFARLKTDPRFRRPKKQQSKIVVDDRFKSILDQPSQSKKRVDKYGRKVSKNEDRDNLRRFYRLEDGAQDGGDARPDYARGEGLVESSDEDEEEEDEESDEDVVTLGRDASKPISIPRDDDDEPEIDLDEDAIAELDAQYADDPRNRPRKDTDTGVKPTTRIAVVNLDWDHVRAQHLFKIFASVDKLRNVRVYPSEFGKERMAKEEREGPPAEVFGNDSSKKRKAVEREEDVNEKTIFELNDGQEYDQDALRKYQLERLRYYYAIVTCDSLEAAEHIYTELEGTELERSANVLDLSYVPEDMVFDSEFRDEATEEQADFKAVEFTTAALRHSKVKLTWDEDDPDRTRITRRTLSKKDLEEIDFKAYIASESEESEADEDEERRRRMRALLLREGPDLEQGEEDDDQLPEGWGTGKPDKAAEIEITFMPGLTGKESKADGEETTLDTYKRKQKEKKAAKKMSRKSQPDDRSEGRKKDAFFGGDSDSEQDDNEVEQREPASKAELAALIADDKNLDDLDHFDMRAVIRADKAEKTGTKGKRKLRKKLAREEDTAGSGFVLDVADKRFNALHEDPAFAIDPSNPKFKRTKGMDALLDERAKRTQSRDDTESNSLESLVASVKRKSSAALDKRNRKKHRV